MRDPLRYPRPARPQAGRASLALLLSAALAGCATGPAYQRPVAEPALAPQFAGAAPGTAASGAPAQDLAHFWHGFGDSTLDDLVKTAQAANSDLKLAELRLREARSNLDFASADRLPAFSVNADGTKAISPVYEFPTASRSQRTYTGYDLSFVANWELDLFGRASSARDAAAAQAQQSAATLAGAQVSVVAEVARYYLLLRGTQERLEVTRRALDNQRASLAITQARFDAGRATDLDLQRALELVQTNEASLPALAITIDQTILHLATLCGRPPAELLERLRTAAPLPSLPATDLASLPVGTPADWLSRRPDLIAAERGLAAAHAEIAVSRAELYPHISLSGLIGLSAATPADLGKSASQRYSVGPTLSWDAFDFGRVRARIAGSEARAQEALESWQQAVRQALEETEGAFTQFRHGNERALQLAQAASHAEAAANLARLRYEAGVTDFLSVLDAERDALSTRDALAQARTDTATALVAVYRTLGGGWEIATATP